MSTTTTPRVKDCSSFIRVLLSAGTLQAKAILLTASNEQVDCLSEIAFNIRRINLGKKARQLVMKSKKILDTLANLSTSVKRRLEIIQRYVKRIIEIITAVKDRLKVIMDQ